MNNTYTTISYPSPMTANTSLLADLREVDAPTLQRLFVDKFDVYKLSPELNYLSSSLVQVVQRIEVVNSQDIRDSINRFLSKTYFVDNKTLQLIDENFDELF